MTFSKQDIERARERMNLKRAKEQLGDHITSLEQVKVIKPLPKQNISLGNKLIKSYNRVIRVKKVKI